MDKFYINCALKEDVNITCAKITKKYYDDRLKSCLSFFPLPVVKISSGCKNCYVQIRVASNLYKSSFNNYITFSGEKKVFEDSDYGDLPILFISEHYRNLLGIDIKQTVTNDKDVEYNKWGLTITPPNNLFKYIRYIIKAAYDHPEIYSFFMYIITLFGLTLAFFSCNISIQCRPAFIASICIMAFSLFIPTRYLPIKFSLSLVWISLIILFMQQYFPS